ncbi:MAG: response regulator [Actinomycetia bacterium]|nr:response regulator [Actinomycetes bacterium]
MSEPISVLIVDDDFRVADIHKGFVEEVDGFRVVGTAQSAATAVEMSTTLEPMLVLLDIYLPDGSGTDVLMRLRDDMAIDCFVLTAARDVATVKRCLDLGALHYLIKPFTKDELTDRLVEYGHWRESLRADQELNQPDIDQIFNGRGRPQAALPKGLSSETMELVISALAGAEDPLGAEDVAQLTGISRVSVRRYLRHLADSGQAVLVQDYGTPGRPRHRFQLVS